MKKKLAFKYIVFILVGLIVSYPIISLFGISNEFSEHAEMMINGYYDAPEDSADVVFIGNSHVYRFFQSAFAWRECGLASNSWSTSDLPYGAIRNVAVETLKTQSPKVVVFDLSVFANEKDSANNKIYLLTQNMKISKNYFEMIRNYCSYSNVKGSKVLQYYFPIIQFHDRWKSINQGDFCQTMPSYLNSCYQEKFLTNVVQDKTHICTDKRVAVAPGSEQALRDLLQWCSEQKDVDFLFYAAPLLKGDEQLGRINYLCDIVRDSGVQVINFNDQQNFEELGLDVHTDFQDSNHTNVKGSLKFTKYLSSYLMEKWEIPDRRGDENYAEWDTQADGYYQIVGGYLNQ